MDFLALKDISEQFMELVNPTSPGKLIQIAQIAGLQPGQQVIDFGCGYGEVLALWAGQFGIRGVGIDVRQNACARARRKLAERGFADRIEIACGDAGTHQFTPGSFHVAACIGATFIWQDFGEAVSRMAQAIRPDGRLIVGEAYWRSAQVPAALARQQQGFHTEIELLQMAQAAGFDFETVIHSSTEEWDRYESANWRGLLHWLDENPNHPQRNSVLTHLHESQTEYLTVGREFFGWALYLLKPAT